MTMISAVVPCYNEGEALPYFFDEFLAIATTMHNNARANGEELSFELVLVDDGSTDGTLGEIKQLVRDHQQFWLTIHYLSLSRNFGKEAALYAGLSAASGDLIATLDADLQDPPSLLPLMYEELLSGDYDNVALKRTSRKGEPPIRSLFARGFYRIINRISKVKIIEGARDFRLMKRPMVDAIISLGEYNRFSKGIFDWVGFQTKWLEYPHTDRVAGETKWSLFGLFRYALEGIVAFSTAPLYVASAAGVILCLIALIAIIFIVVRTLLFGDPVAGWPSLACLIIFIGGLQLFCLGIFGQYLAKTYLETKHRPLYILRETNLPRY